MKNSRFGFFFFISSILLLIANLILIIVFSNLDVKSEFYNALNVSSLVIAFVSFIASSFFSFSVYLQTKNQNKINDSLPKKDDQYIIANYSLFNIETEVSCFSINGDEKVHCLKTKNYLQVSTDSKASSLNRLVFLPTDSVNMPTYKVLVKSVEFVSAADETLCIATSEKSVDGFYSANVLNRGYNCFSVDILGDEKSFDTLLANSKYIKISLDIISVFNVKITATFYVHLHGEKDTSNNPDKKLIPDLKTYTIHHSNYQIEDKTIVTAD